MTKRELIETWPTAQTPPAWVEEQSGDVYLWVPVTEHLLVGRSITDALDTVFGEERS